MKTMVNIKMDKDKKDKAQKLAKSLGLTMTSVMNNYVDIFLADGGITFGKPPYTPNEKTTKELLQASRDYKDGKNISPTFSNAEDAIAFLNKNPDERDWL